MKFGAVIPNSRSFSGINYTINYIWDIQFSVFSTLSSTSKLFKQPIKPLFQNSSLTCLACFRFKWFVTWKRVKAACPTLHSHASVCVCMRTCSCSKALCMKQACGSSFSWLSWVWRATLSSASKPKTCFWDASSSLEYARKCTSATNERTCQIRHSNEYHKSLMQTAKLLTSKMNGLFQLHPLTAGKSHQRSFLSPHQTHSYDVTGHVMMRLHCNHTERWQDRLQWQRWTNCNVLTELRHFYIPGADLNKITDFFFSTSWC